MNIAQVLNNIYTRADQLFGMSHQCLFLQASVGWRTPVKCIDQNALIRFNHEFVWCLGIMVVFILHLYKEMRKSARHCVVRNLTIGARKEANPPYTHVRVVAMSARRSSHCNKECGAVSLLRACFRSSQPETEESHSYTRENSRTSELIFMKFCIGGISLKFIEKL
jgi:hypothetical protein